MEIKEFLKLAQLAGSQKNVFVLCDYEKYIPIGIQQTFDKKGNIIQTAMIQNTKTKEIDFKNLLEIDYADNINRDCIMYKNDTTCSGLNKLYCKKEKCNFYKPKEKNIAT